MPEGQDASMPHDSNEETLQESKPRALSRSPHPYHRRRANLPHATLRPHATFQSGSSPLRSRQITDDEWSGGPIKSARSTESDSGTEADDEHFLKGLPAPRWRPRKGLRSEGRTLSSGPSPLVSSAILSEEHDRLSDSQKETASTTLVNKADTWKTSEKSQRKRRTELGRRLTEVVLLAVVGAIVTSCRHAVPEVSAWKRGLYR